MAGRKEEICCRTFITHSTCVKVGGISMSLAFLVFGRVIHPTPVMEVRVGK